MEQSVKEEKWNFLTHALGTVLSIVGLVILLLNNEHNSNYATFSIWVYSFSACLLFTASALYHYVSVVATKTLLRKFDHIGIYFLIAGTYTPVCLISLADGIGGRFFWIVWGITALGVVLKLFFTGRFEALSLLLYLAMGWLIVFDFNNLMEVLTKQQLVLLILGGVFYTIGTVFYAIKKIPFHHVIWHLFVLAGAIAHFLMILAIVRG
ncbi:PAQR family membrane homeostasis protein TrhA [Joostella sp. CR20]|uniref:PAQR family membrane homeostasis protein TrhA n=1 Tax=Joostella sp. CR20 TaxID=2804312 RepID=UPI00313A7997